MITGAGLVAGMLIAYLLGCWLYERNQRKEVVKLVNGELKLKDQQLSATVEAAKVLEKKLTQTFRQRDEAEQEAKEKNAIALYNLYILLKMLKGHNRERDIMYEINDKDEMQYIKEMVTLSDKSMLDDFNAFMRTYELGQKIQQQEIDELLKPKQS